MIKQIAQSKGREIQDFCRRHNLDLLILFGSSASGTTHLRSDVDLAVQPAFGTQLSKLHLIEELGIILDGYQIDLTVISTDTDPLLLFEIFSDGSVLYERTIGLFENRRLKAWHLYLDTRPLRELEKSFNENRIREFRHVT